MNIFISVIERMPPLFSRLSMKVLEELHPEVGFLFEDNSEEETHEQQTQTPVDAQTSTAQLYLSTTQNIGTQFTYHSKQHKALNVNSMLEETENSKLLVAPSN